VQARKRSISQPSTFGVRQGLHSLSTQLLGGRPGTEASVWWIPGWVPVDGGGVGGGLLFFSSFLVLWIEIHIVSNIQF
jgi:hypothetical protein